MRYTQISDKVWGNDCFRRLTIPEKLLYVHLLTCPLNNLAGYYQLTVGQLKLWVCSNAQDEYGDVVYNEEDEALFRQVAKRFYAEDKLWKYDRESQMVLLPSYLKYNRIASPTQMKGLLQTIKSLPKSELLHLDFLWSVQAYVGKTREDGTEFLKQLDRETKQYALKLCREHPDRKESVVIKSALSL